MKQKTVRLSVSTRIRVGDPFEMLWRSWEAKNEASHFGRPNIQKRPNVQTLRSAGLPV